MSTIEERFWAKVEKTDICWLWTGTVDSAGYGRCGQGIAHRYAYKLVVGPIPEGLSLDHLCRVRNCVRPDHLEPVTQRENVLRGVGTAATHAKQTHCDHGHEFTTPNTIIRKNGSRECRTCKPVRDARRYSLKVGGREVRGRTNTRDEADK